MRRSSEDPALVNTDPEGEGWFFKLTLSDTGELDGLYKRRMLIRLGSARSDALPAANPARSRGDACRDRCIVDR